MEQGVTNGVASCDRSPSIIVAGLPEAAFARHLDDEKWFVARGEKTDAVLVDIARRAVTPYAIARDARDSQPLIVFPPLVSPDRIYVRWIGADDSSIDRVIAFSSHDASVPWQADLAVLREAGRSGGPRLTSTLHQESSFLSCLTATGGLVHLDPKTGQTRRVCQLEGFRASDRARILEKPCYVGLTADSSDSFLGYGDRLELRAFACETGEPRGVVELRDTRGYNFERYARQLGDWQVVVACGAKHSGDAVGAAGTLSKDLQADRGDRVIVCDLGRSETILDGRFAWHIVSNLLLVRDSLYFFAHTRERDSACLIRMWRDGRWEKASGDVAWRHAPCGELLSHQEGFLAVVPGSGLLLARSDPQTAPTYFWRGGAGTCDLRANSLLLPQHYPGGVLRFDLGESPAASTRARKIRGTWEARILPPPALQRVTIKDAPHVLAASAEPPGWITWRTKLEVLPSKSKAKPRPLFPDRFGPSGRRNPTRYHLRSPSGAAFGIVFEGGERRLWIARREGSSWSARSMNLGEGVPVALGFDGESVLVGTDTPTPTLYDSRGKASTLALPAPLVSAVSPAAGRFGAMTRDELGVPRPCVIDAARGTVTPSTVKASRWATLCASASGRLFYVSQAAAQQPGITISELDVRDGSVIRVEVSAHANLLTLDGEAIRGVYPDPKGSRFAFIDESGSRNRILVLAEDGRLAAEAELADEEVEEPVVWSDDGSSLALWFERGLITMSFAPGERRS